jgi:hypothetical protein
LQPALHISRPKPRKFPARIGTPLTTGLEDYAPPIDWTFAGKDSCQGIATLAAAPLGSDLSSPAIFDFSNGIGRPAEFFSGGVVQQSFTISKTPQKSESH